MQRKQQVPEPRRKGNLDSSQLTDIYSAWQSEGGKVNERERGKEREREREREGRGADSQTQ